MGIEKVSQWVSKNPSVRVGLEGRKGEIAVGCDADIIFFDPDASFTVRLVPTSNNTLTQSYRFQRKSCCIKLKYRHMWESSCLEL